MARITIFHTSDLHNKLDCASAQLLDTLKDNTPDSLLLDSGDAIWAGNIFWRPGGEPILDMMSDIPYDAMTLGNREFHFMLPGLVSKTSRAAFPVLSANLRASNTSGVAAIAPSPLAGEGLGGPSTGSVSRAPSPLAGEGLEGPSTGSASGAPSPLAGEGWGEGGIIRSHVAFERAGLRITVFGLSVPCITERMKVKRVSAFYFEQPIAAALQLVPRLRPECDLLIALTHIGIKADRELAEAVPGIDVILGGHTHTVIDPPERVGDTWILHHGHHGHHVGRVDVEVNNGVFVKNELIPLADT